MTLFDFLAYIITQFTTCICMLQCAVCGGGGGGSSGGARAASHVVRFDDRIKTAH